MCAFEWQEPFARRYSDDLLALVNGQAIVAQALAVRGLTDPPAAAAFLDPARYRPAPPTDLPDLAAAADLILMAIRSRERLAVWGDFDVDGQTSTTTLVSGLRTLGADVIFHIPVRAAESHGVNLAGLKELIAQGASLILTCDTGITAHDAADFCKAAGVDLIVTDHHSLPETLPDALALVNPRRLPAGHPAGTLSGAGTAYLLLAEVANRLNRPEAAAAQLDLVALGLVADLVELTGDCRYLVQQGLARIRALERPALAALAAAAGLELERATEEHISFMLAPRLNALGRLGDANEIVDFFSTSDPVKAGVTAARLDGLNLRRKLLTDQVFAAAAAQVEAGRLDRDHAVLVLSHPLWPAGILGIAASRLVELYQKPVILLTSPEGEPARGSARSVPGIDITAAIGLAAPLLAGYGGHPMAAGMALPAENIPAFQRELDRAVSGGQAGQALPFTLPIDAYLNLTDIHFDLVEGIETLAPFGQGNPPLLFASRDLEISSSRTVGRPGDHLQVTLKDPAGNTQRAIWWNGAGGELPRGKFDLAYHLRSTSYLGEPQIQVEWVGWRQKEAPAVVLAPRETRRWIDLRSTADPAAQLKTILSEGSAVVFQEGAHLSPVPGADRYQLSSASRLVVWTCPSSWDEISQILEAVEPQTVYLFAQPAQPSLSPEILKRLLGLMQFAVQTYDGWIPIEKLAALTALPEGLVQLGVDLILSRAYFRLAERQGSRMRFEKGIPQISPESQELEDDFVRLAAEVNAFRAMFMGMSLEEIKAKLNS